MYISFSIFYKLKIKKTTLDLLEYITSLCKAYATLSFELKGFFLVLNLRVLELEEILYRYMARDAEIRNLMLDTEKPM